MSTNDFTSQVGVDMIRIIISAGTFIPHPLFPFFPVIIAHAHEPLQIVRQVVFKLTELRCRLLNQSLVGSLDLLKALGAVIAATYIWVKLQSKTSVTLLDFLLRSEPRNSQHSMMIFRHGISAGNTRSCHHQCRWPDCSRRRHPMSCRYRFSTYTSQRI